MASKTISISHDAYEALRKEKRAGESFSALILRILGGKQGKSIMELAGAFRENSEEWENIENLLYKQRTAHPELDKELVEE